MKYLYLTIILLMSSLGYSYATNPEYNYEQAIENKKFTIVFTDLVKYSPKSDKSNSRIYSDSYLSVDGNKAILRIDPKIDINNSYIVDHNSSVKKISKKSAKNSVYAIKLQGELSWLKYEAIVTLYKNSNICYIQFVNPNTREKLLAFNGYITL